MPCCPAPCPCLARAAFGLRGARGGRLRAGVEDDVAVAVAVVVAVATPIVHSSCPCRRPPITVLIIILIIIPIIIITFIVLIVIAATIIINIIISIGADLFFNRRLTPAVCRRGGGTL